MIHFSFIILNYLNKKKVTTKLNYTLKNRL